MKAPSSSFYPAPSSFFPPPQPQQVYSSPAPAQHYNVVPPPPPIVYAGGQEFHHTQVYPYTGRSPIVLLPQINRVHQRINIHSCACLPSGFAASPLALFCALLAFCLCTVTVSNGGDIFWAGWTGPYSSSDTKMMMFRMTRKHVNKCDVTRSNIDVFCSDFFTSGADSVSITSLDGGEQLGGAALFSKIQYTFGCGMAIAVIAIIRFISSACNGCVAANASSGDCQAAASLQSKRVWMFTAGFNALAHALAYGFIVSALNTYTAATVPFVGAQKMIDFSLRNGYTCASIAGLFHIAAAVMWVFCAIRHVVLERKERIRGGGGVDGGANTVGNYAPLI